MTLSPAIGRDHTVRIPGIRVSSVRRAGIGEFRNTRSGLCIAAHAVIDLSN